MPYKERETEKVYFKIAEVAAMIHQATSLVRFWEDEFEWLSPKKNKVGNRQYTRADIQTLLDINNLVKGMGMTLDGMRDAYKYGDIERLKSMYKERRNFVTPKNGVYNIEKVTIEEAFDPGVNADMEYPIIKQQ